MIALLTLLLLAAAFYGYVALLKRMSAKNTFGQLALKGAGILIVFRLGIFWFLLFLHWTERLGYSALALMVFLLPEALALPRNFDWTLGKAFGVSGLLSAGSCLWSLAAVSIVRKTGKFSGN